MKDTDPSLFNHPTRRQVVDFFGRFILFSPLLRKSDNKNFSRPNKKEDEPKKEIFNKATEINKHFHGVDLRTQDLIEITGEPQSIIEQRENIAILFYDKKSGKQFVVSPLALRAKTNFEHPADRLLRFQEKFSLKMSDELKGKLKDETQRTNREIFLWTSFFYPPNQEAEDQRLVVVDVAVDGTSTVLLDDIPDRLKAKNSEFINPNFLRVAPDSEFLTRIGYRFNPREYGDNLYSQVAGVLSEKVSFSYSGRKWRADALKKMGIPLQEEDMFISHVTRKNDEVFFEAYNGFFGSTRSVLYKFDRNSKLTKFIEGPGRIDYFFNEARPGKVLLSIEGLADDDKRSQSLYERDLMTGVDTVIDFPGESRNGHSELYTGAIIDRADGLILDRYGFPDEGGGIWWMNKFNYGEKKYLLPWNHLLGWQFIPRVVGESIVSVAKEVDSGLYMTVNLIDIKGSGKDMEVSNIRRLARLPGWNNYIQSLDKADTEEVVVWVESFYSYDDALNDAPKALYKVLIN